MIYKTERAKYNAVVEEIAKNYQAGRPVLVGTTSIEKNELLSSLLKKKGISHELLNAKNHEREAAIISKAGEKGAVTVATNMAGRGVDIILGGDISREETAWQKKHDEVVKLGGLHVIGTERHESRRIDNQLRGRSGRQGDPGQSTFFVSLEDDLMRIFGGEQISKIMNFLNFPEDQPLSHAMVSKAIEQAQVKVEGFNFDIRKHLVDYDDVLNKQREIVYSLRKKILFGSEDKNFYDTVYEVFDEEISSLINAYSLSEAGLTEEDIKKLAQEVNLILPISEKEIRSPKSITLIQDKVREEFKAREKKLGKQLWIEIIKAVFLSTIDKYWMDHLTAIEDLREGINLRGYAQIDPLVAYKNEAYSMFEKLIGDINFEVSRRLLKVEVDVGAQFIAPEKQEQPKMVLHSASKVDPFKSQNNQSPDSAKASSFGKPTEDKSSGKPITSSQSLVTSHHKIGRNDPCWCGSGRKYKRCHYPN